MRRIALLTPFALILTVACGSSGSPSPKAEFSILPSPATTTIIQGQSGTVQVTASRLNGETGAIALTLSGPPAGVTGSGSIAGGGTSATFTVQVAGTVAAGTYPLTIQASDGTLTHTAALSLTVESVTASHWQFDAPVAFFAVQDGTGAWTPVSGSGGVYAFTLNQAKGAVAYVLEDTGAGTSDVVVTYGTALDDTDPAMRFRAMKALRESTGQDIGTAPSDAERWRQYVKSGQVPPLPWAQRVFPWYH